MLTSEFLKTLTEDELGILFLIAYNTFNYEVSYNCLKVFRRDKLIYALEKLKGQILPGYLHILENFQKKISEDN